MEHSGSKFASGTPACVLGRGELEVATVPSRVGKRRLGRLRCQTRELECSGPKWMGPTGWDVLTWKLQPLHVEFEQCWELGRLQLLG